MPILWNWTINSQFPFLQLSVVYILPGANKQKVSIFFFGGGGWCSETDSETHVKLSIWCRALVLWYGLAEMAWRELKNALSGYMATRCQLSGRWGKSEMLSYQKSWKFSRETITTDLFVYKNLRILILGLHCIPIHLLGILYDAINMPLQEYNQQKRILLKSDWSKILKFLTSEKMLKRSFKTYRCISATKLHIFV